MSTTTTNLSLVKPATSEAADITVINSNMDTIDSAVAARALASRTVNGHALTANVSVTAGDLSLGNVTNTSDANKPVSTAQQSALDAKANIASPTFTGTVGGVTSTMVGLGNCDNTSDANKPVSSATTTALNAKVPFVEVINTVASAGTAQTLSEPATKSINDLTLDNASPCVLTFPTGTAGTSFTLVLRQSGSTRLVTWPGGLKWSGGAAPTLSTASGSIDVFTFVYVTAWNGFVAGLAMA